MSRSPPTDTGTGICTVATASNVRDVAGVRWHAVAHDAETESSYVVKEAPWRIERYHRGTREWNVFSDLEGRRTTAMTLVPPARRSAHFLLVCCTTTAVFAVSATGRSWFLAGDVACGTGTPGRGAELFEELEAACFDVRGRFVCVDAHQGNVHRFAWEPRSRWPRHPERVQVIATSAPRRPGGTVVTADCDAHLYVLDGGRPPLPRGGARPLPRVDGGARLLRIDSATGAIAHVPLPARADWSPRAIACDARTGWLVLLDHCDAHTHLWTLSPDGDLLLAWDFATRDSPAFSWTLWFVAPALTLESDERQAEAIAAQLRTVPHLSAWPPGLLTVVLAYTRAGLHALVVCDQPSRILRVSLGIVPATALSRPAFAGV
jgi:hypothetical protein